MRNYLFITDKMTGTGDKTRKIPEGKRFSKDSQPAPEAKSA
jgi:hypothetical protein